MFKISYNEVYSSFFSKVESYDLTNMVESHAYNMMQEWLHSVFGDPRIVKFFKDLNIDDEVNQLTLSLNKSSGSEQVDKMYVTNLLATGVALKWVEPKYRSQLNTNQVFGGKEEKYHSQAQHMTAILSMKQDLESSFYKLIRDYGVYHNDYVK